jgi:hypothetical protein
VWSDLVRIIPTVCMFLSGVLQECVNYFTVYMLLLQDTTISDQDMGNSVLETSRLTESKEMIMDQTVLSSI